MPPKRRVPSKGANKAPPRVELDEDAKDQLKNELDWVTTQLQLNIQKASKQEQVEKLLKVINTLSSEKVAVPKKRALMRQYFPNYRNLIKKDLEKWESETARMEKDANFANGTSKGFSINIRKKNQEASIEESVKDLKIKEDDFKWQDSNESFSFNFKLSQ